MKKHAILFAFATIALGYAYAQSESVDQSTESIAQAQAAAIETIKIEQAQAAPAKVQIQVIDTVEAQPLVQQPTTVVEASPLGLSRAEQIRKAREQQEIETEQKIVEKLEESRMEDERRRAEALFGNKKLEVQEAAPVAPAAPVVQAPAPAPEVVPVAPVQVTPPGPSTEDVREAVRAELKAVAETKPKEEKKASIYYVGGNIGMMNYGSDAVETKYSTGVSVGTIFPTGFSVGIDYNFSEHYVDESYWVYRQVEQHNIALTTKYNLMLGKVRPNIGAMVSYTYREYSEPRDYAGYSYSSTERFDSSAFDGALVVGLDVAVSDNFVVGIDYKYFKNFSYQYDGSEDELNAPGYANLDSPLQLENDDYSIWGLNVKFTF